MNQQDANKHHFYDRRQTGKDFQSNILIRLGITRHKIANPHAILDNAQSTWQERILALRALIPIGGNPESSQRIVRCLDDKEDTRVRIAATEVVGLLCQASQLPIGRLLRLLYDQNPEVKTAAIHVLSTVDIHKWVNNELVGELIRSTQNKEEATNIRVALIFLLGTLGEKAPVKELVEVLRDTTAPWEIRDAAAFALGTLDTNKPVFALKQALYDREQTVRVTAAFALGKEEAIQEIIRDLKTENHSQKTRAAQLLGELASNSNEAIDTLASLITFTSGHTSLNITAILALGKVGEECIKNKNKFGELQVRKQLEKLRKSSNLEVCKYAEDVLYALYPDLVSDQETDS